MFNFLVDNTTLIALTVALVELVKKIDSEGKLNRFYPLFSIVFGLGLSFSLGYGLVDTLVSGIMIGLSASGLYRGVKVVINEE